MPAKIILYAEYNKKRSFAPQKDEGMYWYQSVKIAYAALSVTEKKVADYLLAASDSEKLPLLTLRSCAEHVSVGQQTVVRCLQKCGFASWKEFLRHVCSAQNMHCSDYIAGNLKLDNVPARSVQHAVQALSELAYNISLEDFKKLLRALRNARMIDIYGVECSVGSAVDLAGKLLYLGMNCRTYTDMFFQKVSAEYLSGRDVAIGISQSGQSKVTVEALKRAKVNGAFTVAVTCSRNSRLTEYSDLVFVLPSIYAEAEWINSRVVQAAFNDMIYQGLLVRDEQYKVNIEKSGNSVADDVIY